jgi:hypothetical protein
VKPRLLLYALLALTTIAAATPTNAARVNNLVATHHDGQTFLTWTCPPGTGWKYRVYTSTSAIYNLSTFWSGSLTGSIGDSTWCDRRLSLLTGTTWGYATDSLAAPLNSDQAVFVITPATNRAAYYCVTAESSGRGEDRSSFVLNGNSLVQPVYETVALPRPIYQRTLSIRFMNTEIYTLWVSRIATPLFAVMGNRDGMAYDCAIVRGDITVPNNSLLIRPHPRGGSFLEVLEGSGLPGEWRLALDEPWLNTDGNTFWYGWHENYDVTTDNNVAPSTGVIRDYTMQRVLHTVLWARRTFPVDPTKVFAYGYSMGGIGSVFLAFKRPDLIAGVMAIIGKFDFGFSSDPNPACAFNTGGSLREVTDHMWGPVEADLPTSDGPGVYQQLNDGFLASQLEASGVPPVIAFSGKNDVIVGWAEKIGFYQAMQQHRQGGTFFWDERTHVGTNYCTWSPMQDVKYLYRFRTNRSYPAVFNCSANFNPGLGSPTSGDSVGTINGYVEWDTVLVDQPDRWETTLSLRDLAGKWKTYPAPESVTINLTPRRLQSFPIVPYGLYAWNVRRTSDGAIVQSGMEQADSLGLLTLYWLKVYRAGSKLHIERVTNLTGVGPGGDLRGIGLSLARNPVVGSTALSLRWPTAGNARVELLDVAGRRVRSLLDGPVVSGESSLRLDTRALAGGIYFLSARQAGAEAVQRVVVLK